MNAKRLPKEVFIAWEGNDDDAFLTTGDSITELASKNAKTRIGTYRLVREDDVILVTKISQRKVRS